MCVFVCVCVCVCVWLFTPETKSKSTIAKPSIHRAKRWEGGR